MVGHSYVVKHIGNVCLHRVGVTAKTHNDATQGIVSVGSLEKSVVQASIVGGRFGVKDYPRLFFLPNREQGDPIGPSLLVSTEIGGHWDETWRGAVEVFGEFVQTALPHCWVLSFQGI